MENTFKINEGRRKKEEGRRKKEEGRRTTIDCQRSASALASKPDNCQLSTVNCLRKTLIPEISYHRNHCS
ncbi:MAG: hypothetical protein HC786_22160 [Richelia sp. CSU_2_1]|nr:hypothetical protein [Richelia sp. CSU_2_1]